MEARAPHQPATPQGPRNLAAPLAAWLRTLGFTVSEHPEGTIVEAHWVGSRGERFQLTYNWTGGDSPDAVCRLRVQQPGCTHFQPLFTNQRVRRLKEARLLLLGNVQFHNARLLARPVVS